MLSQTKKRILLMQGNEACAEGAIAAGANFFAGYPITPATEIAEVMSVRMPMIGGKFLQMAIDYLCCSYGAVCGFWGHKRRRHGRYSQAVYALRRYAALRSCSG